MREKAEIVSDINQVLMTYVEPHVMQHGGAVRFSDFVDGIVILEMSGACSGCAGSTATLRYGIKNILISMIPEVTDVDGFDDPYSDITPYIANSHWIDENIDELLPESRNQNNLPEV